MHAPQPPSAHPSLVPVFFKSVLIKLRIVWFGSGLFNSKILSLNKKSSGKVIWFDKDLDKLSNKELKDFRKKVQIIFQDPYGSLNPRMTIGNIICEPLNIFRTDLNKKEKMFRVLEIMDQVGLSNILYNRFPHELSGGQCQRVGIARSIINNRSVLICDEPVSSLDLSVQSQILDLLNSLKEKLLLIKKQQYFLALKIQDFQMRI